MSVSEVASILQLEVRAGSDVLRHERLTRDLWDELAVLDGVDIVFGAAAAPIGEGRKGTVETVLTLVATITALRRPVAQVLVTAIQEWCVRDSRRVVHVKDGDRSLEITGDPTEAQQRAIEEFMRQFDDRGESSAQQ
jgi:hypothetical protein